MQKLNMPEFSFKFRTENSRTQIFDIIRKKFVQSTPEELVRQNMIHYLVYDREYPASLISIEREFKLNKVAKRADILVFSNSGLPYMVVECKAPTVKIDQVVFEQVSRYNMKFNARYLVLTNGIRHYTCSIDANSSVSFLHEIPFYERRK